MNRIKARKKPGNLVNPVPKETFMPLLFRTEQPSAAVDNIRGKLRPGKLQ